MSLYEEREPCSHVQLISQSHILLCLFQKNPQIMYLEQELESLKAVLEIKNEKLRQQDVKLMKMEKLVSLMWSLMERGNT